MIIGITGLDGSGKNMVTESLGQNGFIRVSFSEVLREEIKKRNLKITKENLIETGNYLRTRFGRKILARLALQKVEDGENYVFTSIRNPLEAKFLQSRHDFLLVNIQAPEKVRLKRL